MTIQIVSRYDDVKVTKIKTDAGILSWFVDQWDGLDIYITFVDDKRKTLCFHHQSDNQFNGIVRDFLKK